MKAGMLLIKFHRELQLKISASNWHDFHHLLDYTVRSSPNTRMKEVGHIMIFA